jgi:hypothetical protein
VTDQPKQPSSPQGAGQPQGQPDDKELTDFLKQQEGHTDESAKRELQQNREGVKARHKKHKEK